MFTSAAGAGHDTSTAVAARRRRGSRDEGFLGPRAPNPLCLQPRSAGTWGGFGMMSELGPPKGGRIVGRAPGAANRMTERAMTERAMTERAITVRAMAVRAMAVRAVTVRQSKGMFGIVMRMPIIRNSFSMPPRGGAVESHRQDRGASRRRPLRHPRRRGGAVKRRIWANLVTANLVTVYLIRYLIRAGSRDWKRRRGLFSVRARPAETAGRN